MKMYLVIVMLLNTAQHLINNADRKLLEGN